MEIWRYIKMHVEKYLSENMEEYIKNKKYTNM